MKRSGFLRARPLTAEASMRPLPKSKRCSSKRGGCGEKYKPLRPLQKACSPLCAQRMMEHEKGIRLSKAAADDKRKTRAQLEALKTIPQLKKEAQSAFNSYIRARDRAAGIAGCICCGRPLDWGVAGGAVDAGHFRSTGSADHLRFNEDNCHAQRSDCNRYGAGRAVDYRIGLIRRIGLERVEALESNSAAIKWTREGLREIRDRYRRLARELEKQ